MGRKPCCVKVGLKRGPWTIEEDQKLMSFILSNGIHCWRTVPKLAGLLRCGKSCRLRWINYLRPDLKRGGFTEAEEDQIIHLHQTLGNKWSKIASHFEGRTDNEIKNHWNTRIKKILKEKGIDTTMSHKSANPNQTTNVVKLVPEVTNNVENQYEGQFKNAENKLEGNNDKKFTNELEINNDDDLLSNYEIFSGRLEVLEHWLINEESIDLDEQSSSVASFKDSLSASMNNEQISPGLLENPWFDEMESFFGFSGHL